LDAADAYRQKTKTLITKYEELTQSLFLDMFGDPVRNPMGWEKVPLKGVTVKIGRGKSPKYSEYETGFWAINQKCIKWGVINSIHKKPIVKNFFLDLKNEFKAKKDDVLINSTGTGTLGRSGVYNLETDDMIDSHVTIVRPILENVKSIFLSFFFNQKNIQSEIYRTSVTGSTNQIELNKESFSKFQIYLPPIDIQNQFAERVQAIEVQKTQAQASLVQAEDLFNSLLQKAFKGELS
jgi:type I restriction enzyme S subunit